MSNTIYFQMPDGEQHKLDILTDNKKDLDSLLDELVDSGIKHISEAEYKGIEDAMQIELTSEYDPEKVIAVMTTKNIYDDE